MNYYILGNRHTLGILQKIIKSPCKSFNNFKSEVRSQGMLPYSVMQSDGNSFKIDTFREAITYELMISS